MADIFIFRRDLRIADNLAWAQMTSSGSNAVLPIFIFNETQASPDKNKYYGAHAFRFMLESLADLNIQLRNKLRFFYTTNSDLTILNLIRASLTNQIKGVWFNADVTPYARMRDFSIKIWCQKKGIPCHAIQGDYTLVPPGTIRNTSQEAFQVFTPFHKAFLSHVDKIQITKPGKISDLEFVSSYKLHGNTDLKAIWKHHLKNTREQHGELIGGREQGLKQLSKVDAKGFKKYEEGRNDIWNEKGTTRMGAYLKFGCVSVREMFVRITKLLGAQHALAKQLVWREFYANIAYSQPEVLYGQIIKGENKNMRDPVKAIKWSKAEGSESFRKWCEGKTGVPIVDAGMRQLVQTGYMHNRTRLIVASYLTKNLQIDWRLGERFFAQNLLDYDPASNNGNWQWVAGTGTDFQPFDRTFNPFLQARRYDPNCIYIRRWIPELSNAPPEVILRWDKVGGEASEEYGYPIPS